MDNSADLPRLTELAGRVRVALRAFYRDALVTDADEALELESWLDVLAGVAVWEFKDAWAEYQRSGPRSDRGTLHKPDAGAIWSLVMAKRKAAYERARLSAPPPTEPERPKIAADAAQQILARCGFTPQRIEAVRSAPMARTLQEAEEKAPRTPHWSETAAPEDPRWEVLRASLAVALDALVKGRA